MKYKIKNFDVNLIPFAERSRQKPMACLLLCLFVILEIQTEL